MSSPPPRTVLVVGAGLIGARRARIAAEHAGSRLSAVCDLDLERARAVAGPLGAAAHGDWRRAMAQTDPAAVVVSTTNDALAEVANAALRHGCNVLVEKPFGRNGTEAAGMAETARRTGRVLAVGFNHRFHPAVARVLELGRDGGLGELQFARCVYGHGGRPGYEREWRTDAARAGGGELLDQGVHAVDLLCRLLGTPRRVQAELATAAWPIAPVEDNAFALLRFGGGAIASLHASWSQWQNRFQWQVYGSAGAAEVEGLGGSYGTETLTLMRRRPGAPPEVSRQTFDGPDRSFEQEWQAFLRACQAPEDAAAETRHALRVMEVIDSLYRSARQ